MTDGVVVRQMVASDLGGVAELLRQLGYPTDVASLQRRVAIVSLAERYALFVAARDGLVIGAAGASAMPLIHADGMLGRITMLVVDERERGRGVGRALVAAAERSLSRWGCLRVQVTSAEHRRGAHAFYTAAGFARSGLRFDKTIGFESDAPSD